MRWRIPLVLSLVAFVAVSCDQQPAEPTADQLADAPTFNFENAPPFSGIIERAEFPAAYSWVDFKSGLRLTLGFDVFEYCDGTINFDLVWFQDIYNPSRWLGQAQGEMQAAVWDFLDFDCELFTTVPPVASGVADFINTDNSWEGVGEDDQFTNSWNLHAKGTLSYSDGGAPAQLNAFLKQLFGENPGYKAKAKISLH
jgi:hypothetical protein